MMCNSSPVSLVVKLPCRMAMLASHYCQVTTDELPVMNALLASEVENAHATGKLSFTSVVQALLFPSSIRYPSL